MEKSADSHADPKPRILIVADGDGDPSQPSALLDQSIYEVKTAETFAEG
jgi:hypothetical protein